MISSNIWRAAAVSSWSGGTISLLLLPVSASRSSCGLFFRPLLFPKMKAAVSSSTGSGLNPARRVLLVGRNLVASSIPFWNALFSSISMLFLFSPAAASSSGGCWVVASRKAAMTSSSSARVTVSGWESSIGSYGQSPALALAVESSPDELLVLLVVVSSEGEVVSSRIWASRKMEGEKGSTTSCSSCAAAAAMAGRSLTRDRSIGGVKEGGGGGNKAQCCTHQLHCDFFC
uniref:Uncharacterized protein n=1 Tax=Leersia perrieri TaxID=77586 RepID=A0A0D9XVR2_9ORYZ